MMIKLNKNIMTIMKMRKLTRITSIRIMNMSITTIRITSMSIMSIRIMSTSITMIKKKLKSIKQKTMSITMKIKSSITSTK